MVRRDVAHSLRVGQDLLIRLEPFEGVSVGANCLALGIPNIDTRHSPESTMTLKPATQDAFQEDGCLACAKGAGNLVTPQVTKATSTHDTIEAVPRD